MREACACLIALFSASWAMRNSSRSQLEPPLTDHLQLDRRSSHLLQHIDVLPQRRHQAVRLQLTRAHLEDEGAHFLPRAPREILQAAQLFFRAITVAVN